MHSLACFSLHLRLCHAPRRQPKVLPTTRATLSIHPSTLLYIPVLYLYSSLLPPTIPRPAPVSITSPLSPRASGAAHIVCRVTGSPELPCMQPSSPSTRLQARPVWSHRCLLRCYATCLRPAVVTPGGDSRRRRMAVARRRRRRHLQLLTAPCRRASRSGECVDFPVWARGLVCCLRASRARVPCARLASRHETCDVRADGVWTSAGLERAEKLTASRGLLTASAEPLVPPCPLTESSLPSPSGSDVPLSQNVPQALRILPWWL
ncbi:uncharacterized protein C8Q71DRAFT_288920 [Rhodofomes roseus]|uniref:Uncharacterized protein n=1 Tax=Rhodofomes roseus TaxID=34475 RepID=A0ABQ8K3N4_9APHY|nr:uncharacterized protein C8Q71DRAFT_288920 [Rhodofomes roseus]KAH9831513.1 hypothetical protein C8Q71DRAFT_288920 [Rhodofomes roseus]